MVSDQRDDPRLSWVDVDNVAAGREMTEYLLRLGHRRIAFFNSLTEDNSYVALRTQGYRAALAAHGVPEEASLIRFDACPGTRKGWKRWSRS